MKEFNLDNLYAQYLKRVELKEDQMHPIQRKETKRAFMAGIGQLLVLQRDELSKLPEEKAVEILQDLWDQVGNFWLSENNKIN